MPTYEFRCPKCGKVVELNRRMDDDSPVLCCEENCGTIEMVQVISKSSFQLKGVGWASDGYSKVGGGE